MCKEISDRRLNIPTVLLVFYSISLWMALIVASTIVRGMFTPSTSANNVDPILLYISLTVEPIIIYFSYPVVGWMVDVIIGRSVSVSVSLSTVWLGVLLQVVSSTVSYYKAFGVPEYYTKYCISGVSLIMIVAGATMFFSVFLAYGMDQLTYEPSAKMRAFVHWIGWGTFVGHSIGYMHFVTHKHILIISTNMGVFGLLTMALVLHVSIKNDIFIPSGKVRDSSYKMALSVLRFASSNKYPQSRSALGQWQQDHPSRIDLAKSKYGGPFTEDVVDNTKTFIKVIPLLLACFGIYIPYTVIQNIYPSILQYSGDVHGYGMPLLYVFSNLSVLVLVPLFELVAVPLYPKIEFFVKPFPLLISSNVCMIITLVIMVALELTGTFVYKIKEKCIADFCYNEYTISYLWYAPVFAFIEVTLAINVIGVFGFICSQASSSLVGLLTTSYWFIRGMYTVIGSLLPIPFIYSDWKSGKLGDSAWIIVVQLVTSILGLIILLIACKRYKMPSRGNQFNSHVVIENNSDTILSISVECSDDDILNINHPKPPSKKPTPQQSGSIQNELLFTQDDIDD